MGYVYLIFSPSTRKVYVGSTNNLVRRVSEHNRKKSAYTSNIIDWVLIHSKSFLDTSTARAYEKLIKCNKKYRLLFYAEAGLSSWR